MSIRHVFRVIRLCAVLLGGTLLGAPMNPRQLEDLLRDMSRPKIAHTIADENDDEDDGL